MRCNPLRWFWGLLPVLALSWLAVQFTHADIEADLKAKVDDQLKGSGFKWVRTAFAGRDGVITGVAADDADPARAYDIARSIWGVRVVDNQATVIDKVDPYEWSVAQSGGKLLLSGYVPNESVRADIVKSAKSHFPMATITDEMKLARGVPSPAAWLAAVNFGLKEVAGLKAGEARLKGLALAVAGEAADLKSYATVKKALASELPKDVKLVDDRIQAPVVKPYMWAAKQSGGQLHLSGYVPARSREEVLAAAKSAFPRATIEDRAEIAEGAAGGHLAAVAMVLRELGRLEDGSAEIRDQKISIEGLAATQDVAEAVGKALKGLPQGFQVSEAIKVRETGPKPVVPYTTSVHADPASVLLVGYAPSDAAKDRLAAVAAAQFPGHRVVNQLAVAPGAPDGWLRCFEGALAGAGKLGRGDVILTGRRIDVTGTTEDEKLAGSVPEAIKAAVGGDCDANVRIDVLAEAIPNLIWRAALSGNDIVLDGDVPNAGAKSALAAAAQRLFTGKTVIDRMRIVETRAQTWGGAAEQGLVALAELQKGEAILSKQQLSVTGQAADASVVDRIHSRLGQTLPKGYTGREDITVAAIARPPPLDPVASKCQEALRDTAKEGMIRFERASATLTAESFPTLKKLAEVVKTCPDVTVEIEGHTDSEGTPERNQALSDRRSQSVVDYLTGAGVDAKRLTSVGYGETRPLVPNDSAENRAKNRRIEFTVKAR